MHRVDRGQAALLALAMTAGLTLMLAGAVYLLDRPVGSAWLVPSAWQAAAPGRAGPSGPVGPSGTWFGPIGLWLPSFAHAFAFSVLTAWLLPRRRTFAAAACLAWALVDSLAEIGQHAAYSASVAAAIGAGFDDAALAVRVGRYFTQGSFDPADLAAGLAGCALAYLALHRFVGRDAAHGAATPPAQPQTSLNTRWGNPP